MEPLAVDDLHGAVVAAVQCQVQEENCQEIVWGSGGAGDTKSQTEEDVYGSDHNKTNQPGLGLGLSTLRSVRVDEPVLHFLRDDLGHDEENLVIVFHNPDVVGVDWDDNDNNDVNLKDAGKIGKSWASIGMFTKQKRAQNPGPL